MSPPASLAEAAAAVLGAPAELVRALPGGTHAETAVVDSGGRELVVRRFPPGDPAVDDETAVLEHLTDLGPLVPALVAAGSSIDGEVIVTTLVDGGPPDPALEPIVMARQMARMLARIHALPAEAVRERVARVPEQETPLARAARAIAGDIDGAARVFSHGDFWCGNALWRGGRISGVVDWSGARRYPRGGDVAWCRQDLVLLGSPAAANMLVAEYERASGATVESLRAWDIRVGAYAEQVVETWAPNYAGIGRVAETPVVLRRRLEEWNAALL